MSELEVRIEKLDPMRMVSAYGFGKEPEGIAWEKIKIFAKNKGLLRADGHPTPTTYGFNNPNPSKGSPNYGYEIWLPVAEDVEPNRDLRIVDFHGGLYAVTTFKGLENIGEIWGKLVKWAEGSRYKRAHHQWLEELTSPPDTPVDAYVFNIYLPIAE